MKTIMIKGKPYVEVKEKLKHFRKEYKNYSLQSDIVSLETTDGTTRVVIKAWITDEEGFTIATGHAYEDKDSTFINKTSFIENCETSAWGRALGCLGIGIETSIASAEEMRNAISQDKPAPTKCCKKIKLNAQKFQAMIIAIANGQEKEVQEAMLKYEIEPAQKNKLTELLTKSKEDVKKTKTSKTKPTAESKSN
jgi:hypothetical protein|tara:strand:+ start:714 stop:1298 length:585 start_codon:yes stop_codon:yes gene_type:complete